VLGSAPPARRPAGPRRRVERFSRLARRAYWAGPPRARARGRRAYGYGEQSPSSPVLDCWCVTLSASLSVAALLLYTHLLSHSPTAEQAPQQVFRCRD